MSSKAREALEEILNLAYIAKEDEGKITNDWLINICKSALDEPLRNCEIGTAEEQFKRHSKWCATTRDFSCAATMCRKCLADWSQMPYESEVKE